MMDANKRVIRAYAIGVIFGTVGALINVVATVCGYAVWATIGGVIDD